MSLPFTGLIAYPITPLTGDGEVNLAGLAHIVGTAAAAGVSGVCVLATSGAGVTFDRAERRSVTEAAVEAARNTESAGDAAVPVYAAISAASTREVLHLARDAEQSGAAGLLLAPFSYLPLSDSEVRVMFERVADSVSIPLCFYNKPVQTQYDVTADTLAWLADTANVVAVKETMRRDNVAIRIQEFRNAVPAGFSLGLSADVQLLSELPEADAWHTGLAALFPRQYAQIWRNAQSGAVQSSDLNRLRDVANALLASSRPIGALHALASVLGHPTQGPRGPFGQSTESDRKSLVQAASGLGPQQ